MIREIINGVCGAIENRFGETYKVYTDLENQETIEPYFLVTCANLSTKLYLGQRYLRENQLCIEYVPASSEKQIECFEVMEQLYDCLEKIQVDTNLLKGTKMSGKVVENKLSFVVNYDMFVYKFAENEMEIMEEIEQNKIVKG